MPSGLATTDPNVYLKQAAQYASNYITNIYAPGYTDTLNLYDVSGLAHYGSFIERWNWLEIRKDWGFRSSRLESNCCCR